MKWKFVFFLFSVLIISIISILGYRSFELYTEYFVISVLFAVLVSGIVFDGFKGGTKYTLDESFMSKPKWGSRILIDVAAFWIWFIIVGLFFIFFPSSFYSYPLVRCIIIWGLFISAFIIFSLSSIIYFKVDYPSEHYK